MTCLSHGAEPTKSGISLKIYVQLLFKLHAACRYNILFGTVEPNCSLSNFLAQAFDAKIPSLALSQQATSMAGIAEQGLQCASLQILWVSWSFLHIIEYDII